ncbi:restriction endonuclease subunit S [Vibrio aestuarianus]|uniref:Restriction endonuclease subunit S n=1 Tax=Vibrio aestuarianus TaxID=28171 RepID=A0A9X4FGX8_9VIBR|nr:restriction endonuclease subunit S [Vibrio aestuarianus]MDE1358392.1 restriction endonuclease subunit S [Vibrio aestuarianus]
MMRHKLGTLCSVVTKGTTPTSIGLKFEESGVPFLRIQNLRELTVSLEDCLYVSADTHETLKRSKIRAGDFLITIAGTIGRVAIVPDDFPECNCNQAVAILRFDRTKLLSRYLLHWLSTDDALNQIRGKKVTATISNLSLSQIKELEIPLPPLEEQKRIATILDKADAIRQKRKQAIDLADEFLRSVFLDMFGDPVTNPKGWEVKEIDQVCTEIVDCVNRTAPTVDYETPYKMIRTTNIRNHKIDLSSVRYVEKDVYEKWVRRLKPEVGDVIFTREAPAGEAGIINFKDSVFLGQRTMHFRPESEKITSIYLLYELMAPGVQQQIARLSAGSTVTHLSVPECKKFKIRTPSIENQQRFTDIVNKVERSKKSLLASLEQSIELFHSLSQKAFSGQL